MGMLSAIYLQYKIMENIMVSSTTKKVLLQSETNTLVIIIAMHFNSSLAYLWTLAEETQQVGCCFLAETWDAVSVRQWIGGLCLVDGVSIGATCN